MVLTSLTRLRHIRTMGVLAVAGLTLTALVAPTKSQSTTGSTAGGDARALPDLQTRLQTSREAVRNYSELLKSRLSEAIRTSGVKGAIGACRPLAPELNTTVGDQHNIEIVRTALRLRNPDNAPDSWEMANLELFLKRLNSGGDAKTLEIYDVVTTKEGQRLFRYMKPIMVGEQCLACHGSTMPQDIKLEIARNYPEDKATGFNLGEMRGAFSIVQEVE
jgi:Protein of unknown function (DUF3365)